MPGIPVNTPISTSSYASLDDAEAYFAGRLNADAWDNATDPNKTKGLLQATRSIDRLRFAGLKTADFVANRNAINLLGFILNPASPQAQDLEFPRNGDLLIPAPIIFATCECALAFLDGVDPEAELNLLNVTSDGVSSVRQGYDRSIGMDHFRAGIPSAVAWTFLIPYLADPREVRLAKV